MFRMLKLKPPNGWGAVAWELAIVTIGVLMALALQQWAENLASRSQTSRAQQAIRQELRDHYLNAVEWRAFSPCVTGQLERIEAQIVGSKSLLRPIELRHFGEVRMAVVAPRRIYADSAWLSAINAGTAFQLTDLEREQLTNEHWLGGQMVKFGDEWAEADAQMLAATRPLELDPGVKLALFHLVDRMRVANDLMDNSAAQIIYWVPKLDAAPSLAEVRGDLEQNSSAMTQFCKEQRLPARDLAAAVNPNSLP